MEIDEDIGLGDRVRDRVSGFEGIVTDIAYHISGCTRFGVWPRGTDDRGEAEWFYGAQLRDVDGGKEFEEDAARAVTSTDFELGERVHDTVSGVEGHVTTITFDMWNCPQVGITPQAGEANQEKDKTFADEPHVERVGDGIAEDFEHLQSETEEATGSIGADKGVRQSEL